MRRTNLLVIEAMLGLCLCGSMVGQQPVSTLRTEVRLVTVDVAVRGNGGANLHGLTCADFTLTEARKPQVLKTCEEHRYQPPQAEAVAAASALPKNVFTNTSVPALPQTLDLILVDYLNGARDQPGKLTDSLQQILRTPRPGHRTAVFVLAEDLRLVMGFTDDAMLESSAAGLPTGVTAIGTGAESNVAVDDAASLSDTSNLLGGVYAQNVQLRRIDLTLDAFRSIERYVAGLPGHKNLFWITDAFPSNFDARGRSVTDLTSRDDRVDELDKLAGELAVERIAVFPIAAQGVLNQSLVGSEVGGRGLASRPGAMNQRLEDASNMLANQRGTIERIADQTGGQAFYGENAIGHLLKKA